MRLSCKPLLTSLRNCVRMGDDMASPAADVMAVDTDPLNDLLELN